MRLFTAVVVLVVLLCGQIPAQPKIVRFPGNPEYGYIVEPDSSSSTGRKYVIVGSLLNTSASWDTIRVIQKGLSLCGPDALSYLATEGDSTRLVAFSLSDPKDLDSIAAFSAAIPMEHIWPRPDKSRIGNIASYFFSRRDSSLIWSGVGFRFSPLEIGRINSEGEYEYERGWIDGSIGRPTLDFEEILLTESYHAESDHQLAKSPEGGTVILSYSLSDHTLTVLDSIPAKCFSVSRRFPGDTVWCLAYTSQMDQNLCRIENGQLVNVTNVQYPLRISDYRLYRDQIEIDTIRCGGDGLGPKN